MQKGNVIEALKAVGLTEYESKAYHALLQQNPITAYQISKTSGIPRARIYEILQRLKKQRIVAQADGDPVRYSPLPVRDFVRRKKEETTEIFEFLVEASKAFSKSSSDTDLILKLDDVQFMRSYISRVLMHARSDLSILCEDTEAVFWNKELSRLRARKVHVWGAVFGDSNPLKWADVSSLSSGRRVQLYKKFKPLFVVSDDNEAVVAYLDEHLPPSGIYFQNHSATHILTSYIRNLRFILELERLIGKKVYSPLEKRAWHVYTTGHLHRERE